MRPVTLIGYALGTGCSSVTRSLHTHDVTPRVLSALSYALGARLLFSCLLSLSQRGAAALGVVEHAVLMGLPESCDPLRWAAVRRSICTLNAAASRKLVTGGRSAPSVR